MAVSFETANLLSHHDPCGAICPRNLRQPDCAVAGWWCLVDVLKQLGVVGAHRMKSTGLHKIEGKGSSSERIDSLELCAGAAQELLLLKIVLD